VQTNSSIKDYIHHSEPQGEQGFRTEEIIATLQALRPPEWALLGGTRGVGVTRLLQELAREQSGALGAHETIVIELPDTDTKPRGRKGDPTEQAFTTFKALRRTLLQIGQPRSYLSLWRRRQATRSLSRNPKFEDVFGEVLEYLNESPIRRIVLDNAHYIRQDPWTLQRLIELRKKVSHRFVLIGGVRLEETDKIERTFASSLGAVREAADTLTTRLKLPQLHKETDEQTRKRFASKHAADEIRYQFLDRVMEELLFQLHALPDTSYTKHQQEIDEELWRVTKGNWVRIDLLAAKIDDALTQQEKRPRTNERPGTLTHALMQQVIQVMKHLPNPEPPAKTSDT
jgi:hypothetical protein